MDLKEWRNYRQCWCPTPQDCKPCPQFSTSPQSSPKAPSPSLRSKGQKSLRQSIRRLSVDVWNGDYS